MGFLSDIKILYHLAKPVRGRDHASRLENFYAGQAEAYDDFRKRFLKGRKELWNAIPIPANGIWVDMGGGTGSNLEYFGEKIEQIKKIYIVDLSKSLLKIAEQRIKKNGWKNVEPISADATTFRPSDGPADVVTFSYSLTMIPEWFAAIDNANAMLKTGGAIGVVDFYVSRKHPQAGQKKHPWPIRHFWPIWFGADNVFLSADHLPYLQSHFNQIYLDESMGKVPYIPLLRAPYYKFIGINRGSP